jgi:hypothetical protein
MAAARVILLPVLAPGARLALPIRLSVGARAPSAASELVALWGLLRKVLPRYGLRPAELLPVRKGKETISEYVGKYIEAGLVIGTHSWKGRRRVEFDRLAKTRRRTRGYARCG